MPCRVIGQCAQTGCLLEAVLPCEESKDLDVAHKGIISKRLSDWWLGSKEVVQTEATSECWLTGVESSSFSLENIDLFYVYDCFVCI